MDVENEALYAQLGLPAEPFDSVQFYVPPTESARGPIMPKVSSRKADEVTPYFWTARDFCQQRLLRYLFSEGGEDASLLSALTYQVERKLLEAAEDAEKDGPGPGVLLPLGGDLAEDDNPTTSDRGPRFSDPPPSDGDACQ